MAEFSALRPADRLPASQQQPAFAATVLAHDRARPKEFLAAHLVEAALACWSTWNLSNTISARGTGFAPAHAVTHGRMTGWHRLTIHADLLPQPAGHPGLRVCELDAFDANPATVTVNASLAIDQRYRVRRLRQIVPRPFLCRSNTARASATPAARIAPSAPFDAYAQATRRCVLTLDALHAESGQTQNPRTIASRSHASSCW